MQRLNTLLSISPKMQEKLEKIERLMQDGYTLTKKKGFIDFRNSSGKPVQVYAPFNSSPAGFSWIGFFFPFAVCTQIKEWSYFYIAGCWFCILALLHGITGYDFNTAGTFGLSLMYGYMFPYLRKIAKDKGIADQPKGQSIFIGILLSIICAIPSYIIDIAFGNF